MTNGGGKRNGDGDGDGVARLRLRLMPLGGPRSSALGSSRDSRVDTYSKSQGEAETS